MRRIAISLLLLALALPYARAPLCQAGSHEHAEHHGMAGVPAFDHTPSDASGAAGDCHTLMGCTTVLQTSLVAAGPGFQAFSQAWDPTIRGTAVPIRSRASPEPPPPRTA